MKFKGTKGKWIEIHVSNDRGDYYKAMAENVSICNVTTRNSEQAKANAKLIAASPEMFEMLKVILQTNEVDLDEIQELLTKITE